MTFYRVERDGDGKPKSLTPITDPVTVEVLNGETVYVVRSLGDHRTWSPVPTPPRNSPVAHDNIGGKAYPGLVQAGRRAARRYRECPVCGRPVRPVNAKRHVARYHAEG